MKLLLVASVLVAVFSNAAYGEQDKLIGLAEPELLACAGLPQGQMQSNGLTFYQYGEFSERVAIAPLGQMLFGAKRQKGCEAILVIKDGVVARVTYKTKGIVSGPLACKRIFSEC